MKKVTLRTIQIIVGVMLIGIGMVWPAGCSNHPKMRESKVSPEPVA